MTYAALDANPFAEVERPVVDSPSLLPANDIAPIKPIGKPGTKPRKRREISA